ncbi:MAG: hypothetical protein L0312_00520, partial [Acidobacteria bacterium]|nr:hypothetical protein [Acidobacteriota bacterium]
MVSLADALRGEESVSRPILSPAEPQIPLLSNIAEIPGLIMSEAESAREEFGEPGVLPKLSSIL